MGFPKYFMLSLRRLETMAAHSPDSMQNTMFYNISLGLVMLIGRFGVIIPMLAIAGSLAGKKHYPDFGRYFQNRQLAFLPVCSLQLS